MGYHYSDPKRADDPHALPNIEVWHEGPGRIHREGPGDDSDGEEHEGGWFYAFGFPGCLHDGEPSGPFASEEEALADAREGLDDGTEDPEGTGHVEEGTRVRIARAASDGRFGEHVGAFGTMREEGRIGPGAGWDVYDVLLDDGTETSACGFQIEKVD